MPSVKLRTVTGVVHELELAQASTEVSVLSVAVVLLHKFEPARLTFFSAVNTGGAAVPASLTGAQSAAREVQACAERQHCHTTSRRASRQQKLAAATVCQAQSRR